MKWDPLPPPSPTSVGELRSGPGGRHPQGAAFTADSSVALLGHGVLGEVTGMWGRGWAQAQGGWGPQEERQVLLLSSWLQLMLVGCCPHGAVGTGSSQCRVSCPLALGDATSSDLPWKAADPFPAKPQTLQPQYKALSACTPPQTVLSGALLPVWTPPLGNPALSLCPPHLLSPTP